MSSPEFRLKKLDEIRNYLIEEKKTCKYSNYVQYLFILVSTVAGCVFISVITLLVCVPGVRIKILPITAAITKCNQIIKKNKK